MHKHEKERIKRIKFQQKFAKTKKHVGAAVGGQAYSPEAFNAAANSFSTKDLRNIVNFPDKFTQYGGLDGLVRSAQTVLVERTLKLEKE